MARITDSIKAFALGIGGPGIFIIAFLDSSFLSFPEVNDLLIVLVVLEHPHRMIYYASMATLGSLSGCVALYLVARKGGHALIQKRFSGGSVAWGTNLMRKYGVVALLVPSLLPPPAPFKIFVVLAGVAGVPLPAFVAAIAVGRGVRYFGEGMLAVWWGAQAINYLQDNGRTVALWLGVAALVAAVAYFGWKSRSQTAK